MRKTDLRGKLGLVLMGGAMLSKSSIQFSIDGRGCVPSLLFDLRPNCCGGNEDNANLLQKVPGKQALLHSVPPTLQQATSNPHLHQRLLDTHGQVWVSLLWDHCSFLLGPGAHKVLFGPSKILLPQSCTWRRQWHPTPVLLPGKSHGWRSLVGYSPWGR